MPLSVNWGCISEGATFEALVQGIVAHDDPKAVLFRRSGRDYAQDARSGDGQTVFQAKYIRDAKAATAIRRAKEEFKRIEAHRSDGGRGEELWKGVTRVVFVTNAEFNSNDKRKWSEHVEQLYDAQGLCVELWEKGRVEHLLQQHSTLIQAFFEGQPRAFLSLPEAHALLMRRDILPRAWETTFIGRAAEREQVHTFLASDRRVLIIHGRGGVGKTRFAIEAATEDAATTGWQVLWANLETIATGGPWFLGLVQGRPTLVIADDPDTAHDLRALVSQVESRFGCTPNWKLVITARTPNDPVLAYFDHPKFRNVRDELALEELEKAEAEQIARQLLTGMTDTSGLDSVSKAVASAATNHPVWVSVAVRLLEQGKLLSEMPSDPVGLAQLYLNELTANARPFTAEQLLQTLNWLALMRELDTEQKKLMESLASECGLGSLQRFQQCLEVLLQRRVLVQCGRHDRSLKVTPDVLADHLLKCWLVHESFIDDTRWQPSDDVPKITTMISRALESGELSELGKRILQSLVRVELVQRLNGEPVDLLGGMLQHLIDAASTWTVSVKIALLNSLHDVTVTHGAEICALLGRLLGSDSEPERAVGLFRTRELTHDDVILDMGWLAFAVARYADTAPLQEKVLQLLVRLVVAETRIRSDRARLPNDGKRAHDLLQRVIAGGPDFRREYESHADNTARTLLYQLVGLERAEALLPILDGLLPPLLAVERQHTYQPGPLQLTIQNYVIVPGSPEAERRMAVLKEVRSALSTGRVSASARLNLWRHLAVGHSSAHRALRTLADRAADEGVPEVKRDALREHAATLREHLLEDMRWVHGYIKAHAPTTEELKAAREIWKWYCQFERDDQELRSAADGLERVFQGDPDRHLYDSLTGYTDPDSASLLAENHAAKLAIGAVEDVQDFVVRGVAYLGGGPQNVFRLAKVAVHLGKQAEQHDSVRAFVTGSLQGTPTDPRFLFAAIVLRYWLDERRKAGEDAVAVLQPIVEGAPSDTAATAIITRAYEASWHDKLPFGEFVFVCAQAKRFQAPEQAHNLLQIMGCLGYYCTNDLFRETVDGAFSQLEEPLLATGVEAFVQNLQMTAHCRAGVFTQVADELRALVLEKITLLPDIDDLGGTGWWELRELLRYIGRPGPRWLVAALEKRISMSEGPAARFRIVGHRERLSSLVVPLPESVLPADEQKDLICLLLDHAYRLDWLAHELPIYVHDLDPQGELVAQCIEERITVESGMDVLCALARFAPPYVDQKKAWRRIATAVCRKAQVVDDADRVRVWSALSLSSRPRSLSNAVGEVPPFFMQEAEAARQRLDDEEDQILVPFREWELSVAKHELREQEERAKETREKYGL